MEVIQQMAVPMLGIVAVAAVTFYAVSFAEIREKSFRDLEESDSSDGGRGEGGSFKLSVSSKEKRAKRQASKRSNPSS